MSKQIPLTQGKYALVDDEDFDYLNQWKWHYGRGGYACRGSGHKGYPAIYMHRLIMNTPQGMQTDHINRDKLDNRRNNLRICDASQNRANIGKRINNTSGYTGVARFRRVKWQAYINKGGRRFSLGHFQTKEAAARAYNEKALELFGEYATLNRIKV